VYKKKDGTITKRVPEETEEHFYDRLQGLMRDDPEFFFMRWTATLTRKDLDQFEERFLVPVLEQLWDWWEWLEQVDYDPWNAGDYWADGFAVHWQTPYGFYNILAEGGRTDLDGYLETGSRVGLTQTNELFPELNN
jgi:hypothetical protein